MTNIISLLETSWHLSPPWGKEEEKEQGAGGRGEFCCPSLPVSHLPCLPCFSYLLPSPLLPAPCTPASWVSLLERVYVTTLRSFGYCCGVEWSDDGWIYAIAFDNEVVSVSGTEIVGSGRLQAIYADKP